MTNIVFLGGTCADSLWRNDLIRLLPSSISYFNPVVEDWTPECQEEEIRQRQTSLNVLYTITPKMQGVYSIAEVTADAILIPTKTILCLLENDEDAVWDKQQWKSLKAVATLVESHGATVVYSLDAVADHLSRKTITKD